MILKDVAEEIRLAAKSETTWEVERAMIQVANAIERVAERYEKVIYTSKERMNASQSNG